MSTLAGCVCIRNGFDLDFPWIQAVESLLPVCDEVVICDGESEDSTQAYARNWSKREPKINLCVYPWPKPKGDADFWVTWLNYAREHIKSDWHFQLDADEILHEKSYDELREFTKRKALKSGIVTRWNFWQDTAHTIPEGVCLGKHVVRVAPSNIWLASDGPHPKGSEASQISQNTGIEIFHYGFLRHPEAFFKKERALQGFFFDTYDQRLADAEKFEGNWMTKEGVTGWENRLDEYHGKHPEVIKGWLKQRGYEA